MMTRPVKCYQSKRFVQYFFHLFLSVFFFSIGFVLFQRMITITKIISHFLNQSHTKMNDGEVIKYFTSTYEFCAAVSGKPCDHFYESNLLKYTKFNVHTPDFINYLTDTNKVILNNLLYNSSECLNLT